MEVDCEDIMYLDFSKIVDTVSHYLCQVKIKIKTDVFLKDS